MKQDIGYYQEFGDSMMLNRRNVWSCHRLTVRLIEVRIWVNEVELSVYCYFNFLYIL